MTDATEDILIIITCLMAIACFTAVYIKKGVIMGSPQSLLRDSTKKYIERREKRKMFYLYLGIAFAVIILITLLFTRDLGSMAIFTILNLISVWYFLEYYVLLEPKDKIE